MNLRIQPLSAFPLPSSLTDLDATIARLGWQELSTPITVAAGDGIGPELMQASLEVLLEAGANIAVEQVQIGETSGIGADAWESIRRTGVLFKAPTAGRLQSLSETLRRTLDLYANVRPYAAYHPFVASEQPDLDIVVIRENGYLGAQTVGRHSRELGHLGKILSRAGHESIARFAFEHAVRNGRQKVSCFTPHNILKLTDRLFHTVFQEVSADYSGIDHEILTLEAGFDQLARDPLRFDVVLLPKSNIDFSACNIAGPPGLLASVNAGSDFAVFEAVQGAAPALAGLDIANPAGMILAGAMMLRHIGQAEVAECVHDALLTTLEEGTHTSDIFDENRSVQKVGTQSFARAVVQNLGQRPKQLERKRRPSFQGSLVNEIARPNSATKRLVGVDVFVRWRGRQSRLLAHDMRAIPNRDLELTMISNRGLQVWPHVTADAQNKSDQWQCRYTTKDGRLIDHTTIANLLMDLAYLEIDFIRTENLYDFDKPHRQPAPGGSLSPLPSSLDLATAAPTGAVGETFRINVV